MVGENALFTARLEAARIACGVIGRTKGDADHEPGFRLFKEAYDFVKGELEAALILVDEGNKVTVSGKTYVRVSLDPKA